MLARRLRPRFWVEAAFLVAVAAATLLLEMSWPAVVAAMALAWLIVAAVELFTAPVEPESKVEEEQEPPVRSVAAPRRSPPPLPVGRRAEPAGDDGPERLPDDELVAAAQPVLRAVEPPPAQFVDEEPLLPPPPGAEVVELTPAGPRQWNLWDLERRARERAGVDPVRDEEWSFLLMYLREFANADGMLPADFDRLVRESFGELLAPAR